MLGRLPYRIQIPFGLSLAVLLAALLVTAVSARVSARRAHDDTVLTVERAATLLGAQALPLLTADDTWRVFALLRNTAALLPGAGSGHGRAAVLDAEGRVFAASAPDVLETGSSVLTGLQRGHHLPALRDMLQHTRIAQGDGSLTLIDPMRSEDGQLLGYTYIEIDAPVFAPDWRALSQPALIGAVLAVALLVPAGWWMGRRMTRPVARMAQVIERIGHADAETLHAQLPLTRDPELGRISAAVDQLIAETQVRRIAEQRALSAERMATVGRMTAAVAHEINNPLGGLLNATQTLRLHGASQATRALTLDLLQRGLHQIQATVAALLPQARIEVRPLDLDDLDDIVTLARTASLAPGASLSTHSDIVSAMRVPSGVVRQVMLNLLLNACKAAGEGGRIHAVLTADEDRVTLAVSNSGTPLSRSDLERSLTAESGNDPRGFGLWVCSELANQHGGSFALDETCPSGTRLVFWIPNRERHEDTAAA
ncbi:MAG: hypothetical protein RLZZ584_1929 [Pseudomonadota bacterium]